MSREFGLHLPNARPKPTRLCMRRVRPWPMRDSATRQVAKTRGESASPHRHGARRLRRTRYSVRPLQARTQGCSGNCTEREGPRCATRAALLQPLHRGHPSGVHHASRRRGQLVGDAAGARGWDRSPPRDRSTHVGNRTVSSSMRSRSDPTTLVSECQVVSQALRPPRSNPRRARPDRVDARLRLPHNCPWARSSDEMTLRVDAIASDSLSAQAPWRKYVSA